MKPTDQIRAELNMNQPHYRLIGHLLADQLDCLEKRLDALDPPTQASPAEQSAGDPPDEPEPIRAPAAEVNRTRKGRRK